MYRNVHITTQQYVEYDRYNSLLFKICALWPEVCMVIPHLRYFPSLVSSLLHTSTSASGQCPPQLSRKCGGERDIQELQSLQSRYSTGSVLRDLGLPSRAPSGWRTWRCHSAEGPFSESETHNSRVMAAVCIWIHNAFLLVLFVHRGIPVPPNTPHPAPAEAESCCHPTVHCSLLLWQSQTHPFWLALNASDSPPSFSLISEPLRWSRST